MSAAAPTTADPQGYALAYEEAKRALAEQERVVTELRSRAGILIASAAITTSFLGDRILGRHVHPLAWIAIGCFVLLGLAVLSLLWPWKDWKFTVNAQSLIQNYLEPSEGDPLDLPGIHRDLALHMEASWQANDRQLRWLFVAFRIAAMLLVGEIVFWVLTLATQS